MKSTEIDMTYSFLSDEEPSDEQLEQLMREVVEEARQKREEAAKKYREAAQKEFDRLCTKMQPL